MKPLKLGLDLDGCFANFNAAFMEELIRVTGRDRRPVLPEGETWRPATWNWMADLGYAPTEIGATWQAVDRNPLWWATLNPLPDAMHALIEISAAVLAKQIEAVFLTTRFSPTAHWQSVEWLRQHTLQAYHPQVCVCPNAESKGLMAKALGLEIVLDDYTPNLMAVKRHSPATRVVVFDQAWNRAPLERAGLTALGHESVPNLVKFVALVDDALKARG